MDTYRLIVLAVFTAADLAIVAKASHAAYRINLLGRFAAAAARGVAAVRAAVPGKRFESAQEDDDALRKEECFISEQVARLFSARCIWFAKLVNAAVAVALLGSLLSLYTAPAESPAWWKGNIGASGLQIVVVPFGLWCPWSVNEGTLPLWHVIIMLSISLAVSPWGTDFETGMFHLRPLLHVLATGLLFGCPQRSVLLLTNAVFGACAVWSFASAPDAETQFSVQDVVRGEAIILLGKVLVHWRVMQFARVAAEQDIRSRMGQCQRSAVTSLLGMMCDAVVDLDAGLRMKAHEASLANLLMHGPGKSLKREGLAQFLVPGPGRERFEERMAASADAGPDGPPGTGMFTGRLRDAIGNSIGVVFYHVPYTTITGALHHLIGMRENTGCSDGAPTPMAIADVAASPDDASQASWTSTASSRSVPGETTLTLDVFVRDGLPIQHATESVRKKLGVRRDSGNFLDVVARSGERAVLIRWIRQRARDLGAPRPRVEVYGDIEVRSAATGRAEEGRRKLHICFPEASAASSVSLNLGALRRAAAGGHRPTSASTSAPRMRL